MNSHYQNVPWAILQNEVEGTYIVPTGYVLFLKSVASAMTCNLARLQNIQLQLDQFMEALLRALPGLK